MTRYPITTSQEVHHQINGAKFYSKMGHGFHQVPHHPESSRLSVRVVGNGSRASTTVHKQGRT